MVDGARSGL